MSAINSTKLKVGLTGYTGFIGASFLKQYAQEYDIQLINLRDPQFTLQIPGLDALVHCAGLAHQDNPPPKEEYFRVNFEFTKKLADTCVLHQVKHFIYLSTFHVNLKNPTSYSESKVAAENYLNSLASRITMSIIRPPMVYGENCKGNFPKLAKLIKLSPILPFMYSDNRRSLIYVENLTGFISHLLNKKLAGTFSPQDEKTVSIQDLSVFIASGFKQNKFLFAPPVFFLSFLKRFIPNIYDRLYNDLHVDPEINLKATGYKPLIPTDKAIEKTIRSLFKLS